LRPLALVAIVAGLSLAACSGSSSSPSTARQAGEATTTPSTEAPAPPPALSADPAVVARAGASVTPVSIPSVAHRGEVITASFDARPGAACQLLLRGGGSDAPLPPAVADRSGRVAWTWRLSANAEVGTLTAWVSCSGGALAQAQLMVT